MARRKRRPKNRPWLRSLQNTKRWYATVRGQKVPLRRKDGTFIDGDTKEAEEEASTAYHELMLAVRAGVNGEENEVRVVLDLYLQSLEKKGVHPITMTNFTTFFRSFRDRWPGLTVGELTPEHVRVWWQEDKPHWQDGTRLHSFTALRSALNWASSAKSGFLIPANPLRGMEVPSGRSRGAEAVVTPEEHARMLAATPPDMHDILTVLYETGTRPGNVCRVTAREFDAKNGILLLEKHKTAKRGGKPLVVPLTDTAVKVCVKLVELHPEGPLFRTKKGLPWTPANLAGRIATYAGKLGLKGRYTAYSHRHSLATRLLENGVPDAQVAAILGHANTSMLHRHYSHLGSRVQSLRGVLVNNPPPEPKPEERPLQETQGGNRAN